MMVIYSVGVQLLLKILLLLFKNTVRVTTFILDPTQYRWYCIYIWYWGLFYQGSDDIWDYMAITVLFILLALALLVGGLYWKRASRAGARAALLWLTALTGLGPIKYLVNIFKRC